MSGWQWASSRGVRWAGAVGVLALGLGMAGLSGARAADVQERDFNILVDGKPAGTYHMTIQRQEDGTVTLSAQSEVKVSVLLVTVYSYSYRGQEVWKDGKLQHLESSGNEKGKPFTVQADVAADGLHVRANGQEHVARPDVWTTSCWQLPAAPYRNAAVTLLGCDNGQEISSSLQLVGTETIQAAGQTVTCTHYRVTKDVPHEVWYDGQERLMREEWVSASGHRTVLELAGMH